MSANLPAPDALYTAHIESITRINEEALDAADLDAVVIDAGEASPHFLDDQHAPWRTNPHFAWWTPLAPAEGSALIVAAGQRPRLIWVQPEDYWHMAPEPPPVDWCAPFELEVVADPEQAAKAASAAIAGKRCGWVGPQADRLSNLGAVPNPAAWLHHVHYHRACKTEFELEALRAASARGVRGHEAARDAWLDGRSEFGIHQAYLQATEHTDAELPYGSIVATGRHAAVLHYQHLRREAVRTPSFLIDAGASERGYGCDITRTWASSEVPEFEALVASMDTMQQQLIAAIEPQMPYPALHALAHRQLAAVLLDAELATGTADALVETGVTRAFLPHGLGHMLGLQTHDVGGLIADSSGTPAPPPPGDPMLRNTRTIEAGQVFTIEPGLYFIDSLLQELKGSQPATGLVNWSRIDSLYPCGGIRIEDNIAVHAGRVENLTRDAFAASAGATGHE